MKILIAYATRAGSTAEVATEMGRVIAVRGHSVDLRPVTRAVALAGYDAVIVGSAVRMGRWLPEALRFIRKRRDSLAALPVAYFEVCLTMRDPTPENRAQALDYVEQITREVPEVEPRAVAMFAGVFDPHKLGLLGAMMRLGKIPAGDYRDWQDIRAWADDVPEALGVPVGEPARANGHGLI